MSNRIYYAGTVLNGIKILEDLPSVNGVSKVLAECPFCQNIFEAYPKSIKNGTNKSCKCQKGKELNKKLYHKGETVNNWYIIDDIPTPEGAQKHSWVKAICPNCGLPHDIAFSSIKNGSSKSCGCVISHGNKKIEELLNDNKIDFAKEFSFNDLIDIDKLRFDFAIFKNNQLKYLIEYDGKQHYNDCKSWGNINRYQDIKKKDLLKNEYCLKNNIPLIRIPYYEYDNLKIEDLLLETSNFIIN